jgi:hypothetical protein
MWLEQLRGCLAVCAAPIGALIGVNIVAVLMQSVFGRSMSWFTEELSCLALYGPAATVGLSLPNRVIIFQLIFCFIRRFVFPTAIRQDKGIYLIHIVNPSPSFSSSRSATRWDRVRLHILCVCASPSALVDY